jgi:hypothetical protein
MPSTTTHTKRSQIKSNETKPNQTKQQQQLEACLITMVYWKEGQGKDAREKQA